MVIKILERHGWTQTRVNGSHHMLKKDSITIPVPVHGSQDLGIGLLKKIETQTGVKLT
ncbi:MAG: type II toxin-antitoxin system HicA family toxin [Candidatus Competibacteraceae bacterium]|nr:type II toxin-antitoxin system HicA family toxin [Candidatus Contendobacter odensis]MBK8534172.1 type II toxin-antitoxin system HicA family toxin [Candidatus Competibacteraceae bacterium]MBK8752051.1 type II toxin-antitoxin system HicA family toxin [Candidatus Competibacteraceae bacterium]